MQDKPDAWPCEGDEDCRDGMACYGSDADGIRTCRPAGYCERESDCQTLEACRQNTCTPIECDEGHQDACAPYACSANQCLTLCQTTPECDQNYVCKDRACVPP